MVLLSDKRERTRCGAASQAHEHKRTRRWRPLLQRLLPALLLLGLWAPAGFAADIVVMTAEDRLDGAFATYNYSQFDPATHCGTVVDAAAFPAEPSLREALIYANHTPGPDTITFAPALSGQTLPVNFGGSDGGEEGQPLPVLCGSDIMLTGDIDGDGTPDITLDGSEITPEIGFGLFTDSDNNTITSLALQHFSQIAIGIGAGVGTAANTGNQATNNTIGGGTIGILVYAGAFTAGALSDTHGQRQHDYRHHRPRDLYPRHRDRLFPGRDPDHG